jgi:hypothetical protein
VRYVERWKEGTKTVHPHLDIPVKFATNELIRSAGREHSARDLHAAKEWLARQSGTLIEGSIYLKKYERVEENFRGVLFAQSRTRGESLPGSDQVAETNYVWPSAWFCRRQEKKGPLRHVEKGPPRQWPRSVGGAGSGAPALRSVAPRPRSLVVVTTRAPHRAAGARPLGGEGARLEVAIREGLFVCRTPASAMQTGAREGSADALRTLPCASCVRWRP